MSNFIVRALFLQALSTSPLWLVFKSWAEEWLRMPLQLLHFFNWSLQAWHGMPKLNFESQLSASDIFLQVSCDKYQIDSTFFAFDQTHTTAERRLTFLGGSASNSISEVSPYNEVWQTRSQVTSLFGREPFALNLRHVYLAASSLGRLECNRAWHAWTRECHPHCNALHIMASPYLVRWELSVRITVPCGL